MSRSRKRTPMIAMTTAESDAAFKRMEHQRERVAVRSALVHHRDLPSGKAFGDPWRGAKDGKQYALTPNAFRK